MQRCALLIASIILFRAEVILGDGGIFIPITHTGKQKISSDAQKALIVWWDGQETLHVRSSYRGPAVDFAWVIPVPTPPRVARSDWTIFEKAEKATRPQVTVVTGYVGGFKGLGFGCSAESPVRPEEQTLPTGIRSLETLDIRELHIDIVAAGDAASFIRWLRGHEYAVSKNAEHILQKYIDQRFCFVVSRINQSGTWAKLKGVTKTVSGGLTPLSITFPSKKPFYPLTISAISSAPENELLLLVAASQRTEPVEYPSTELNEDDIAKTIAPELEKNGSVLFDTSLDFASAIKAGQRRLPGAGLVVVSVVQMAWQGNGFSTLVNPNDLFAGEHTRITRFHAFLKPSQMTDITFVPAKHNKLLDGRFYIDLTRHRPQNPPVSRTSASLIAMGLFTTIASKCRPHTRGNLQKPALFLILLAMIIS